jgi:hypothetical protein
VPNQDKAGRAVDQEAQLVAWLVRNARKLTDDYWCHDLAKSAAAVSSYAANHLGELIKLTVVLCTRDRTKYPIPSTEYRIQVRSILRSMYKVRSTRQLHTSTRRYKYEVLRTPSPSPLPPDAIRRYSSPAAQFSRVRPVEIASND